MTAETASAESSGTGPRIIEFSSAAELLGFGKRAFLSGQNDVARQIFEKLSELRPDDGEVEHWFGLLLHRTGERETGLARIEKSLASPDAGPGWWSNYGNVLQKEHRLNDAIDAYRRCLELDPNFWEAYSNLGLVQRDKHNLDVAEACFRKALEIKPDYQLAWFNLGQLQMSRGRVAEASVAYNKAVSLVDPSETGDWRQVAHAYAELGEHEKAREVYERWLAAEPDNVIAAHYLAALSGKPPPRAADPYVEATFDAFSESFDRRLAGLKYRAPELVAEAVAAAYGPPCGDRAIADAGCGTGLCGIHLRPFASRLVGVDLSTKMIAKARERGLYDELAAAELTAWFGAEGESFDLIASADTLCYFGDLEPVLTAFRSRLLEGGIVVFTVEASPDDRHGYGLMHHGRYIHHRDYLAEVLRRVGFVEAGIRPEHLRMENGAPVHGYLVEARRPPV